MTERMRGRSLAAHDEVRHEGHPAPGKSRVGISALWFGVFGAPLAWSLQEVASVAINSFGCVTPNGVTPPAGVQAGSGTWLLLVILTVAMMVLSLAALFVAWRNWHAAHTHEEGEEEELLEVGEGRTRFMSMAGILLGAVFSLLITMNLVSIFLTPQCTP